MGQETAGVGNASIQETFIRFTFCLLGIGILLPWNAFVSAKHYFEARLCSELASSNNKMEGNIELIFGLVYNLSSVLSLGGLIWFQWMRDKPSTESRRKGHPLDDDSWWMVVPPLYVYLAVFLITSIMVLLTKMSTLFFLVFTIFGLSVCGICTAFASAGVVGTAGLFPARIGTQPYFAGQAVGGVAVAFANLMAASLRDPSSFVEANCGDGRRQLDEQEESHTCVPYKQVDWSSFSYFLLGCLVLGLCIAGYSYVDSYKKSMLRTSYESVEEVAKEDTASDSVDGIELLDQSFGESVAVIRSDVPVNQLSDDSNDDNMVALVWKTVKGPAFAIFFNFLVTLAIFPSWTSSLQSVHLCQSKMRLRSDLYTPMSFVIFNVGDLLGRLLSSKFVLTDNQTTTRYLVLVSCGRVLFFPLFLLCVARDSSFNDVAIQNDLFSFLVQISFAVLNGMLTAISFSHGASLLPATPQFQAKASEMLNFALSFGLLCGSLLSFPFTRIATGGW